MNIKYLLGSFIAGPLLPVLFVQGKIIRSKVPVLPEATGPKGYVRGEFTSELKLITIGESTIAGIGVQTHQEGFSGSLAAALSNIYHANVPWEVYAESGLTVKQIRGRLIPKIPAQHADIIVIGIGGNDAFTLNRPGNWRREVRGLIEDLQEKFPKAEIVFCNMPPIKEFPAFTPLIKWTLGNLVEILGDELAVIVEEYDNVYYNNRKITLSDWVNRLGIQASAQDFFSDGVHPSKLTYQSWARDIAQFIKSQSSLQLEDNP